MPANLLPPQVHVFVRDWLSANQVLLKSRDGHVLIDSAYVRHAPLTLALLDSPRGLGAEPLSKLVNTHGHSDHIGGNAAIARKYGCPIAVPLGEAKAIEEWDQRALLLDYAGQRADRFNADEVVPPDTSHVWGDLEWRALAAPGHDMGALVYWNGEHRILISGDALWERGFGLVLPRELDPAALPATRATLDRIAALGARVVIPGHGEPFTGVTAALERAYERLAAFEADPVRVARYVAKALLSFTLLDVRRMSLTELPEHFETVGIYRDLNTALFRMPAADMAAMIVGELERAGAVRRDGGFLVPS
jgi:glyoxylase-like metal-dependent hydrolase (beta-lactamase superfamily II)